MSELAVQVTALARLTLDPVSPLRLDVSKRLAAEGSHDEPGRSQHDQVYDTEEQGCRNLRYGVSPAHPYVVYGPEMARDRGTGKREERSQRGQCAGNDKVAAPEADDGQNAERRPYGETEFAPLTV